MADREAEQACAVEPSASPSLTDLMRALEQVADHVTTMRRDLGDFDTLQRLAAECVPVFEAVGMTNEGDGWGFDWPADDPEARQATAKNLLNEELERTPGEPTFAAVRAIVRALSTPTVREGV